MTTLRAHQAGGVFVAAGAEPVTALKAIEQSRGVEVPETDEQRQWLKDFAAWLVSTEAAQDAAAAGSDAAESVPAQNVLERRRRPEPQGVARLSGIPHVEVRLAERSTTIELILEIFLTALWEISLQLVGEILIEFGFASAGESFRKSGRVHPVLAGAGVLVLGGLAGAITRFIWPTRIFQPGPVRGVSLVLSPVVTGVVMDRYGNWREHRGASRSFIATFWGGAIFAFGMALVRFVWIG